ncbi:hypothetical protein CF327_g7501 [Tilletia walkeri]|nr:hypothetical protein CF327_g7501 [Tilletia walkeri]
MERDARFPLLWQPSALVGHDVQLWLQYTRHEFVKRILVATDSTDAAFWDGITIGLVEVIGRKTIQLIGFAGNAVFLAILGVKYHTLKNETGPFFVVFVFLQLFFNFGANATTFIIPGEVFPTRVRSTAHGLSAACGKLGAIIAIIASLGFAELSKSSSIGNQGVFWIFTAISILGFIVTLFFTIETKGRDADLIDREEVAEGRKERS